VKTALEQNREDQAFGAAWRRCKAALPADFLLSIRSEVFNLKASAHAWHTLSTHIDYTEIADTETEALTALAEALEAR